MAAFNVLNYFNGDGAGGGFPTARGAETPVEFDRQRDKIIAAIGELDADVVGLMELENDDTDAQYGAIEDLVDGLNQANGAGTYDFIDTGVVGTDAIRVGILYQPASVTPVGDFAVLDSSVDPRFIYTLNRPSIAQTFEANADGARITAVVNHLKSKGSDCDAVGDPDTGDGQGNCNGTRTAAAEALVDWLETDPTGSGDPDFLLLGDMNAYAQEDPITAFRDAGYVDTIDAFVGRRGLLLRLRGPVGLPRPRPGEPEPRRAGQRRDRVAHQRRRADRPRLQHQVQERRSGRVASTPPTPTGPPTTTRCWSASTSTRTTSPASSRRSPTCRRTTGSRPAARCRSSSAWTATRGWRSSSTGIPPRPRSAAPRARSPGRPRRSTVSEALSYRSDTDTYSLTWKTAKGSTGCRLLTVALDDGTVHEARFRFTK